MGGASPCMGAMLRLVQAAALCLARVGGASPPRATPRLRRVAPRLVQVGDASPRLPGLAGDCCGLAGDLLSMLVAPQYVL